VKRALLRSSAFVRAAKKAVRKDPQCVVELQAALELLEADAFHPHLRTHKLHGPLKDSWACSAGYDLRIVFDFVQHVGTEAILLKSLGTHDEVY
jgi:mRNA-degrading endonuclease YafQ of YafQ-DinJ toxin-antitoxin module